MKKTLYITMLAAALMGGLGYAEVPTKLDGATDTGFNTWSGKKVSGTGEASGSNVIISEDPSGMDCSKITVYGGWSTEGSATGNTVTMSGGQVQSVWAGWGNSTVTGNTFIMKDGQVTSTVYGGSGGTDNSKNTVIMTGGTVKSLLSGGHSTETNAVVKENTVIVAGNSTISNNLYGGYASHGDAKDNKVYLVGTGATAIIEGQQYTGGALSLKSVYVGDTTEEGSISSGNSVDIYGTGIIVTQNVQKFQILNFNISQSQFTAEYKGASMLTLTARGLNLEGVTIGFNDVDVQAWNPGTSVTLVQAAWGIQGIESGQEVNIKRGDQLVATGQLVLSADGTTLSLTMPNVPEPTTGTLSLLALAALASRRRRRK